MSETHDSSLSILIAENDRIVARDIELTLQRRGFLVVGKPNSQAEALSLVKESKPNIAILSINFGGDNEGIELAKRLKEECGLPVIFLTGRSEDAVFDKARTAKPAGYVRKPFSGAELIASIEAAAYRIDPDKYLEDRIPAIRSVAGPLEESVIVSGIDGRVVLMNESAERLTGWKEDEATGNLYSKIVPTSFTGRENGVNGVNGGTVCLLTDRKGRQHSVKAITTPVRDEKTELLGTITILKNQPGPGDAIPGLGAEEKVIPGQARAIDAFEKIVTSPAYEKAIGKEEAPSKEETEQKADSPSHQLLLDQLGDPLLVLDRDLNVIQANSEALSTFTGELPVLGRPFFDLFSTDDTDHYESDFLKPLVDGKRHRFEFHDIDRGIWFEIWLYRSHEGLIALFHDVSESKITKAEEVRQHRLEGLGLLARGFAHDFNNHLTTVSGNIGLAKELQKDPDLIEMLGEAEVASSRAAGLVQQLMTFATGGRPVREPVKISDLLRQVLSEHRMGKPSIRYQFACADSDIRANVDRAQVRRVIENLLNNAEAAMPSGGTLTVRCELTKTEDIKIYGKDTPSSVDDFLLIEVSDTGVGMTPEVLSKATEPYYSSRESDNATGIGLTVCESIAKAHEGFLYLKSAPGKGTTAVFCVPQGLNDSYVKWQEVNTSKPTRKSAAELEQLDFNPEDYRILVLEDDGQIRRLMGATLRRCGYEVVETAEGNETLSEYRKAQEIKDPFDLVITDLTIEQGMGGLETMRRLREMDQEVVAIVSSGYSDAAAMSNPSAFGFRGVIPKPYSPHVLKDSVGNVIGTYCRRKA
ncbi:MAG: response regulator [Verrucomicrobiales bacterium]|nr:response regulator [Verrucomicrobiales bacterium]